MKYIKKINPNEMLIYIIIVAIFSLLKCFYGSDYLNVLYIEDYLYRSLVFCEEEVLLHLIWLTILFVQMYLVCKKSYLSMMNFNVRNNNRFKHFLNIIFEHIEHSILYSIVLILVQLIIFNFYMSPKLIWSYKISFVIIKYIIEFLVISFNVTFIGVLFNNFTLSYLINLVIMFILMFTIRINIIPFISLFVDYSINVVSIIYVLLMIINLYFLYQKREFYGGVDR